MRKFAPPRRVNLETAQITREFVPWCKEYRKVDSTARWRKIVTSSSINWQCSGDYRMLIHKKINGIRDDYRNNSYNFEAKLMRLSDDIHNCLTEIVDVFQ